MILCNDSVLLTEDLPEISLQAGGVGTFRASWAYPNVAYEVEFPVEFGACPAPRPPTASPRVRARKEPLNVEDTSPRLQLRCLTP